MTLKKVVQDSSGIVGLFNVEQAAQNIYLAMHAIQHRGQDGVGLAISDGENVVCKKGLPMHIGLVHFVSLQHLNLLMFLFHQ